MALFEKNQDIAPLIRPYQRKGSECSPGLHISGWMDEGEVISSFFKYLNISDGVEPELHENGFGNIIVGLNKYQIPRGFDNVAKSLKSYFPESVEAVNNYMRLIKAVNEEAFYINHKLTPDINTSKFGGLDNCSLKDCLQQYHASDELIALLGTFNYLLMGSKADEVPFLMHAFLVGGFYRSPGSFTINGIKRLLANFKRELAKSGVDLFLNSEVAEILTGNDRNVIGVKTLNGDQYFAASIIASFNPKLLNEKLKPNPLRPVYRRRLAEADNTFGLYVAFYKIEDKQAIGVENFVYYNDSPEIALGAISNRSGEHHILSVFLAESDRDLPADIEARRKRATARLALLEDVIYDKIPDLKGKMVLLDFLKPWSFERYTNTSNGSAYGIKQTSNSIGFQHRVPVRGLYLVGQAIYPGFLGSLISSFSLALQLLESDKFWSRVTNQ